GPSDSRAPRPNVRCGRGRPRSSCTGGPRRMGASRGPTDSAYNGRPAMKRLLVVTASLVPLALLLLPAPYAQAQRGPQVTLQLEYQTAWLTAHHPSLHLRVRVVNHGTQAVGQLSLGIILFSPALSRTAYEQSLRADPQGGVVLDAPPPVDLRGSLGPGAARAIRPPP